MNNKSQQPKRRFPAHPPPIERHNEPTVLFVTACLRDRTLNLASEDARAGLVKAWAEARNWSVGSYLIMPDHVHLFCQPGVRPTTSVKLWCKFWKGLFRGLMGLDTTVWQRDVWDTQIRNRTHYDEKRAYVELNPVRRGLVSTMNEWPYKGCLNEIRW